MKGFLTLLFLLVLFGCKQPPSQQSSENKLSSEIDSYLESLVNRLKIPGLTVAATQNDTVIYTGAFGFTNIDTKQPMRAENVFHWASVSKTFVGTAIMQLVEKGKIDLDEKLVTYLPYFKQKDPYYRDITIRQMLNHTSGIGDVADYEWDKPQFDGGALERFVRGIANDKMKFEPGKDWSYSNTAFETLGHVIAKVSGVPFETYIRENILDPLEMTTTSFIYSEIPDSLKVSGHQWAAKPVVSKVYPYNRRHAPSSTLNSNVVEMTHYAIAHLNRGEYNGKRILADASYDVIWKNSVNIENKAQVGVSWFLGERKGLKTVSHGGSDTGFRSFFVLIPEKNISIQVVSNYELTRPADIAYGVLDLILGETPDTIKRQIGFHFAEVLMQQGIAKAKDFFYRTQADSVERNYYFWKEDDAALAYPGYLLLDQGMFPEAEQILKFNLEQFPSSGHAYGHLGIAYARMKKNELARLHLRKALERVPGDEDFTAELEKLEGKPKASLR